MKTASAAKAAKVALKWWQKTSIYEIWPRSFKDSNDDGIGDLKGIISKLDYIRDLGFETIWIAPFFGSPQQDMGYDISDYRAVNPEYGTMKDAEALIAAVHRRKMRIVLDLVMNHTSVEHPWFRESRSSRDNPKRGWYIWRDGNGKKPPNNWMSMVGTRGWQYDEKTGQWYYTSFLPFQPDLNYHNPDVKKAMFDVVRFWLKKGVDGFRLDIFNCIYKDERFRNNPFSFTYLPAPDSNDECFFQKKIYNFNHPKSFTLAKELRKVVDEFKPDRFVVGEVSGKHESIKGYLGKNHDGLNTIFLFESIHYRWSADFFRGLLEKHERLYPYPAAPTYVFSNHDVKRGIMRVGGDPRKAKLLAMFQVTARGIPVVYYGEEIGMKDGDLPLKGALDPIARMYSWAPKLLINILGLSIARDDFKVPMQWDGSPNAGFCADGTRPWLPVNPDFRVINVANQLGDEYSLLNGYRKLLALRRQSPAILEGELEIVHDSGLSSDILAYIRRHRSEEVLVVLNFGKAETDVAVRPGFTRLAFSTGKNDAVVASGSVRLQPYSGVIVKRAPGR